MLEGIPLQTYHLSSNSTFLFKVKETNSRQKYIELVLEKPLDLEKQSLHHPVLTAWDSENHLEATQLQHPPPPTQFQPECIWSWPLRRHALGTSMVRVRATDPDKGLKVEIKYAFAVQSTHIQFGLDHNDGETKTLSILDYGKI